jgi:hypothetical protein
MPESQAPARKWHGKYFLRKHVPNVYFGQVKTQ